MDKKKALSLAGLILIALVAAYFEIDLSSSPTQSSTGEVISVTKVSDGDTIRIGKERVRILGLDTPEVYSPGCPEEEALGDKATARLTSLLNSGTVTIERTKKDQYGRTLAVIRVDGKDVSKVMIDEGYALARKPQGGWCARLQ